MHRYELTSERVKSMLGEKALVNRECSYKSCALLRALGAVFERNFKSNLSSCVYTISHDLYGFYDIIK